MLLCNKLKPFVRERYNSEVASRAVFNMPLTLRAGFLEGESPVPYLLATGTVLFFYSFNLFYCFLPCTVLLAAPMGMECCVHISRPVATEGRIPLLCLHWLYSPTSGRLRKLPIGEVWSSPRSDRMDSGIGRYIVRAL